MAIITTTTTTGFQPTPHAHAHTGAHENAVLNAQYPWTIIQTLDQGAILADEQQLGKVVYLIVAGRLTINRAGKPGPSYAFAGRNKVVHLGVQSAYTDFGKRAPAVQQRELAVRKGGLYDLEARMDGGCSYVEGHVCLSPQLAIELLEAGRVCWYSGKTGLAVAKESIVPLLERMTVESQMVKDRRNPQRKMLQFTVSVAGAGKSAHADELRRWFEQEWACYEGRMRGVVKVATKTLYRVPAVAKVATFHTGKVQVRKYGGGLRDESDSGDGSVSEGGSDSESESESESDDGEDDDDY